MNPARSTAATLGRSRRPRSLAAPNRFGPSKRTDDASTSQRQAVPGLDAEPFPIRPTSATPLQVTAAESLALDCDQRAARDARWRHSARSALGSGLQLATRGSFPVAQHGGTIQSSSGLYIIVKGVSH